MINPKMTQRYLYNDDTEFKKQTGVQNVKLQLIIHNGNTYYKGVVLVVNK